MTLRIGFALLLGSLAAACGSGAAESDGPQGSSSGAAATQPGPPSSAPEFLISCGGGVTKRDVARDLRLEPRCVGGAPGTRCGDADAGACDPQDATFWYELPAHKCVATDVFVWNGTECIAHKTGDASGSLHCKGKDCEDVYSSKMLCEAAHGTCPQK